MGYPWLDRTVTFYTLRGYGAELRARHMRTRWNPGRAWTREVWR